jgi:hypothetical protein
MHNHRAVWIDEYAMVGADDAAVEDSVETYVSVVVDGEAFDVVLLAIAASRLEADTYNKRRRSLRIACRRSFTSALSV